MEIISKPRKLGLTKIACESMLPILNEGKNVFIASDKYPEQIILILKSLGIKVTIEEVYKTPQPEPIYDDLFAIEPNIIDYRYPEKKLTGYVLIKKTE